MAKRAFTFLVLGLLSWLAIFFWRRFNALNSLQINVGGIKQAKLENGFITWVQELIINNPDTVEITANRANIDVFLNQNYVGKCSLENQQTIKPTSISVINVKVTCTVSEILQAAGFTILDLIHGKKVDFVLQGSIGAYGFTAPLKQSISFDFKKMLKNF